MFHIYLSIILNSPQKKHRDGDSSHMYVVLRVALWVVGTVYTSASYLGVGTVNTFSLFVQ